ncbi:MAG: LPD28 domain-containing protein [Oscillospiraceae bacterium]
MQRNARKERFESVELFGKPALFMVSRLDRSSVPEGFSRYEIRGSDNDSGKLNTLENNVGVNYAGSVLSPKPITIPKSGYKYIGGKLNFLGESLTLTEFCEKHKIELPPDPRQYTLRPATEAEAGLFYSQPNEADVQNAVVGHLRMDFGSSGKEFWSTWWPRNGDELNTPEFKTEFDGLINELRKYGPLENLPAMVLYCADRDKARLNGGAGYDYGFVAESDNYKYFIRCRPMRGDYNGYVYAQDKRRQEMNMTHAPDQGMTIGGM